MRTLSAFSRGFCFKFSSDSIIKFISGSWWFIWMLKLATTNCFLPAIWAAGHEWLCQRQLYPLRMPMVRCSIFYLRLPVEDPSEMDMICATSFFVLHYENKCISWTLNSLTFWERVDTQNIREPQYIVFLSARRFLVVFHKVVYFRIFYSVLWPLSAAQCCWTLLPWQVAVTQKNEDEIPHTWHFASVSVFYWGLVLASDNHINHSRCRF